MEQVIINIHNYLLELFPKEYYDLGIDQLTFLGNGVEGVVFKGRSKSIGDVAIKVPYDCYEGEGLERETCRDDLKKEMELTDYLWSYNIPVAKPLRLCMKDNIDFLIMKCVDHDHTNYSSFDLGCLLKRHHQVPAKVLNCFKESEELSKKIASRLKDKLGEINRLTSFDFKIPDASIIYKVLKESQRIKEPPIRNKLK